MAKAKRKVEWADVTPIVLAGAGVALGVRALWRPHRALAVEGKVDRCAGSALGGVCDATMTVDLGEKGEVLSVVGGRAISVSPGWIHVAASNEPVILYYGGGDLAPTVKEGASVARGQAIGRARRFDFGVWELVKIAGKPEATLRPVEPASWLAARGVRVASKLTSEKAWCAQGRKLSIPKSAHQTCGLRQPDPAGFGLLPVSLREE